MTNLLKTVPSITQTGHEPAMKMDRVYDTEQQIASPHVAQFETTTSCNTFGSRQPFVSQDSVDDYKTRWRTSPKFQILDPENPDSDRTVFDEAMMKRCLDAFEPWITDSTDRLGTDIRVATKDVEVPLVAEGKKVRF